jgi:hypothetical protein
MNQSTLTKIQEIYFDLCDILNQNDLDNVEIEGFIEFDTVREFLLEQKTKIEEIERALDFSKAMKE